jgi:hypothetical protein
MRGNSLKETVHVSTMAVTPTSCKGTLDTWRFHRSARWPGTEPANSRCLRWSEAVGKPGAYANQSLNLTQLERPMEEKPRFRTGPEKLGRPGLSGGLGKRGVGEIVTPSRNRKGETGNPSPSHRRA